MHLFHLVEIFRLAGHSKSGLSEGYMEKTSKYSSFSLRTFFGEY